MGPGVTLRCPEWLTGHVRRYTRYLEGGAVYLRIVLIRVLQWVTIVRTIWRLCVLLQLGSECRPLYNRAVLPALGMYTHTKAACTSHYYPTPLHPTGSAAGTCYLTPCTLGLCGGCMLSGPHTTFGFCGGLVSVTKTQLALLR